MKSFFQLREELNYPRLKATALGSSDTAKQASKEAGNKSTKKNHRLAANAHKEALIDNEASLKIAPKEDHDELLKAISHHQSQQDKHTKQSLQ